MTVNKGGKVNIGPTLGLCGSAFPPSHPCLIPLPLKLSGLQCLAVLSLCGIPHKYSLYVNLLYITGSPKSISVIQTVLQTFRDLGNIMECSDELNP